MSSLAETLKASKKLSLCPSFPYLRSHAFKERSVTIMSLQPSTPTDSTYSPSILPPHTQGDIQRKSRTDHITSAGGRLPQVLQTHQNETAPDCPGDVAPHAAPSLQDMKARFLYLLQLGACWRAKHRWDMIRNFSDCAGTVSGHLFHQEMAGADLLAASLQGLSVLRQNSPSHPLSACTSHPAFRLAFSEEAITSIVGVHERFHRGVEREIARRTREAQRERESESIESMARRRARFLALFGEYRAIDARLHDVRKAIERDKDDMRRALGEQVNAASLRRGEEQAERERIERGVVSEGDLYGAQDVRELERAKREAAKQVFLFEHFTERAVRGLQSMLVQ